MSDERWQRVKALFHAAVERPTTERDAFLASEIGDDEALRREVESLLASDAAGVSFLDRLPIEHGASLVAGIAALGEETATKDRSIRAGNHRQKIFALSSA